MHVPYLHSIFYCSLSYDLVIHIMSVIGSSMMKNAPKNYPQKLGCKIEPSVICPFLHMFARCVCASTPRLLVKELGYTMWKISIAILIHDWTPSNQYSQVINYGSCKMVAWEYKCFKFDASELNNLHKMPCVGYPKLSSLCKLGSSHMKMRLMPDAIGCVWYSNKSLIGYELTLVSGHWLCPSHLVLQGAIRWLIS